MFTQNKDDLIEYLKDELNLDCKNESSLMNYRNFGTAIEPFITKHIKEYLIKNDNYNETDFKEASDKNEFPDLFIIKGSYAVEYKSAVNDNGPANDMGTLNEWKRKIEKYEDRIYYIFLEYEIGEEFIEICNCYIEKVYWFIGVRGGEDDVLKYRKKDGNLRPKAWNDFHNLVVYWNTLNDFIKGIDKTISYRAKTMVEQYIDLLENDQLLEIREKIDQKYKGD
jgi:hypothetical protein